MYFDAFINGVLTIVFFNCLFLVYTNKIGICTFDLVACYVAEFPN